MSAASVLDKHLAEDPGGPGPYRQVATGLVDPSPDNPRSELGDLTELAKSVGEMGVIMALVVRTKDEGRFEVICGHRRLAAATVAEVPTVPVVVRDDLSDDERLALMVEENRHRAALTPIEEAKAFRRLIDEMGWRQTKVAERFDTRQGQVSKRLKLLKLPAVAQAAVDSYHRGHSSGITVETALELAELPKATVEQLFADGDAPDQWEISRAKRQAGEERELAKRRKELEDAGVPIIDAPDGKRIWNEETGPVPLGWLHFENEDFDHTEETCHAVVIQGGRATEVCTDPKEHPGSQDEENDGPGRPSDDDMEADRIARQTAAESRRSFITGLLNGPLPADATDHIVNVFLRSATTEIEYDAAETALALFYGEGSDNDPYDRFDNLIATADAGERLSLAFAVALADGELAAGRGYGSWSANDRALAHVRFLTDHGYQPTEWELEQLAIAEADKAKADVEASVTEQRDSETEPSTATTSDSNLGKEDVAPGDSSEDEEPAPPVASHETSITKTGKKFKAKCSCGGLSTLNTTEGFAEKAIEAHLAKVAADAEDES